jgi:hypothetical protein
MVDPPPILLRGPAAFCELHQPFAPDIAPPAYAINGKRHYLRKAFSTPHIERDQEISYVVRREEDD